MGKRGPKPKPTIIKLLAGNPGRRPVNKDEPKPETVAKLPPPPAWLTGHAVEEWKRIGPELVELGLLTKVDLVQFAMYCDAVKDVIECDEVIAKYGRSVTTEKGGEYPRPEVGQKNRAKELVRKFGAVFGLSPSDRSSLKIGGESKPASTLADFIGSRPKGARRGK